MKFSYTYSKNFSFSIQDNYGCTIPISNWENVKDEFLAQFSILYEFHDNGSAEF